MGVASRLPVAQLEAGHCRSTGIGVTSGGDPALGVALKYIPGGVLPYPISSGFPSDRSVLKLKWGGGLERERRLGSGKD